MKLAKEEKISELKKYANNLLEKIFFSTEQEYIDLKSEFSDEIKFMDLSIGNSILISHKTHIVFPNNSSETKTKLVHKIKGEIGWFSLIWDEHDKIIDKFYVLY